MTQSNVSKLQGDTFLLDEAIGSMRDNVETLNAVVGELMRLSQDMSETNINHAQVKVMEWQRMTRVLSQLLLHTVNDLDVESKTAHNIHEEMFGLIQQLDKEKSPQLTAISEGRN